MDGEKFDALVKRLTAARLTRLDVLRGLLASAAVGLTGATLADETNARKKTKKQTKQGGKKRSKKGKAGKKKHRGKRAHGAAQNKVLLCHKGQPLEVAEPAVRAHLNHGDTLGPCGDRTSTTARPGAGDPGPGSCAGVTNGPDPSGSCSHCCQGVCCRLPATQCNVESGLCCAPNCANRECGPDGCGRGGTCGCGAGGTCTRGAVCPPGQECTCPGGQTCNPVSGQCPGPPATTTTTTTSTTTTTTTTAPPCTVPLGAGCSSDSNCCAGQTCCQGTCRLPAGASGCTSNAQCCQTVNSSLGNACCAGTCCFSCEGCDTAANPNICVGDPSNAC